MLRSCPHKLAFSKKSWYDNAIKAIIPEKKLRSNLFTSQYRATATLATELKPSPSTTIAQSQPFLTPLEPLTQQEKTKPAVEDFRRCSGFKKYDGQQCSRFVKADALHPITSPVYCFNHDPDRKLKQKKKQEKKRDLVDIRVCLSEMDTVADHTLIRPVKERSIFNPPSRIYDCWSLWLGDHIKGEQRDVIQQEMRRPISKRDRSGYIYAYSLDEGPRASIQSHAYFKIGRTTDPHRRMYQVANICNYEPKIIELFPSFPISLDRPVMSTNLETLNQTIDTLPKCPISHRVERLIHLELSSLYEGAEFKCPVCGAVHREWIKVNRTKHPDGTLMTNQDLWFANIRPVILRWIQFGVLASSINRASS